jgi:hypothetical protein
VAEAITQAELAEVLAGCAPEGGGSLVFMAPPERVAAEIFEEARLNREPEFKSGEIYRDADGANWEYQPPPFGHPKCCWRRPGSEAAWSTGTPRRPLRRLVPEAGRSDLEAKLDRITAICRNPAAAVGEVMGPGRHVPGGRLAAAVLAVIRGEEASRA